jgi:hypothetical protein
MVVAFVAVMTLVPDLAFADYGGGEFQNKMSGLTRNLVNVLLPAVSILGLVYAAILAAMGDEGSKSRMVLVVIACVVGFLAPLFIRWLQSATGG